MLCFALGVAVLVTHDLFVDGHEARGRGQIKRRQDKNALTQKSRPSFLSNSSECIQQRDCVEYDHLRQQTQRVALFPSILSHPSQNPTSSISAYQNVVHRTNTAVAEVILTIFSAHDPPLQNSRRFCLNLSCHSPN